MTRSRLDRALAAAYRLTARTPSPQEPVVVDEDLVVPRFVLEWSQRAPAEARRLVDQLAPGTDLRGRDVLAVGRGAGDLGIEVALRGARRVVAVDMASRLLALAQRRLAGQAPDLPVKLVPYGGNAESLPDEGFDVVLAADALRSYGAPRDSRHVEDLAGRLASCARPGGLLAVRFGPSWKAPYGGGVDSRLPWAHLVFPESVVFEEFRRVRRGNSADCFEDIGINRITLGRFRGAMEATGLQCLRFRTNVTDRRTPGLLRSVARLPVAEEYLTQNAYGTWRRPHGDDTPDPRR